MLFSVVLCGCSAQYHLRKALKKDPSIVVNDTVVTVDTVWRQIQRVDTVFKYDYSDTVVFINKDSVVVKYFHSHTDSLTYIEADCPDCPEITEKETVTKTIKVEPTIWQQIKNTLPIILIGLAVMAGITTLLINKK